MITEKIKNLFELVEFLHSNVERFKPEVALQIIEDNYKILKPIDNFKDKLLHREIKEKKNENANLVNPFISEIKTKAQQLNICNPLEPETLWNWNISEIQNLKDNFDKDDLMEVLIYKLYYVEIKTVIYSYTYINLFINDLYEILNEIFDYFDTSKKQTARTERKQLNETYDYFDTDTKTETKVPEQGKLKKPKQPLTFPGLFKDEYKGKIQLFYNRLLANGLIDKNHVWRETTDKNEPAKVYFWLLGKGVFKINRPTPALICFCKEFGITAYKDTEPTPPDDVRAVTVKNLLIAENTITPDEKKRFEQVFSPFLIK